MAVILSLPGNVRQLQNVIERPVIVSDTGEFVRTEGRKIFRRSRRSFWFPSRALHEPRQGPLCF